METNINNLVSKAKGLSLLYVEDEKLLRDSTADFLKKIFIDVDTAQDGSEALDMYMKKKYDIVITDIFMPNMNGLELIKHIRKQNEKQEIIIASAYTELSYLIESIKLGVTGYLIKPLKIENILKVLEQSLDKIQTFYAVEKYKIQLEEMVEERTKEVIELKNQQIVNYEFAINSLVKMIEKRDTYTGGHSERVASYSRDIAKELGLSDEECSLIYKAGIVHDIGKIITPDSILLKPGKLNEEEYSLIQDHVTVGYEILSDVPMYKNIADIVYAHHERYDGSGYPRSLKADEIPFFSRIMAIADSFDAMTTRRIYKERKSVSVAIAEIKELSGSWFDPNLVDSAVNVLKLVSIKEEVNQDPTSVIDDERFAYFFKDSLTRVYNHDYLDFVLNKNKTEKNFLCFNIIYIKNFTAYNKKYGWNKGDIFLSEFASYLQSEFSSSKIFRIFGDDFLILQTFHKDIDIKKINESEILQKNNLQCGLKHLNIKENNINCYQDLEDF